MLRSLGFNTYLNREKEHEDIEFLFTHIPEGASSQVLDYALEILEGYNSGRIDKNRDFYVWGYIKAIKDNSSNETYREQKKKVYIFESDDEFCSDNTAGISSKLLAEKKDEYMDFLEDEELKYTVLKYKGLRQDYIIAEGYDIVLLLKGALQGVPDAVENLKRLCEMEQFAEMVQIILASGYSFEELFGEEL